MHPRLVAVVPEGSGAAIIHRALANSLPGYAVHAYPACLEYAPPALWARTRSIGSADVVHAPPDHAVFVGQRGVPLVITFHNYVLDPAMRPFSSLAQRVHYAGDLRLFTRLALRRARAVTAVSEFTAALVREDMKFFGAIEVIPNGVDAARFAPADALPAPGPLRVLFSGNTTRRKGVHLLPEIARLAGPDVQVYATAGLRGGTSSDQWSGLKTVGRVPYDQMPALYRQFDVLLLPSVREGMSLALLEAMASGLAVVASCASSNPELVADGTGGLLCPVGEPEAYANALRRLAADRALVRRMGAHNRTVVEQRYTLGHMVQGYARVFERVIAEQP